MTDDEAAFKSAIEENLGVLRSGLRSGGFPVVDGKLVAWSTYLWNEYQRRNNPGKDG